MNKTQNSVDKSTLYLADFIKSRGISLQKLAETICVPYYSLYNSLGKNPTRSLRADELIKVCSFLGFDLIDLANNVLDKGA